MFWIWRAIALTGLGDGGNCSVSVIRSTGVDVLRGRRWRMSVDVVGKAVYDKSILWTWDSGRPCTSCVCDQDQDWEGRPGRFGRRELPAAGCGTAGRRRPVVYARC
ncbi:hypothetical protein LZ30DRAFT_7880 [Colletotrichum cereale]|nr:hypothetical protein LZ30DRAFT_7880 [Colletotrichum cereale]